MEREMKTQASISCTICGLVLNVVLIIASSIALAAEENKADGVASTVWFPESMNEVAMIQWKDNVPLKAENLLFNNIQTLPNNVVKRSLTAWFEAGFDKIYDSDGDEFTVKRLRKTREQGITGIVDYISTQKPDAPIPKNWGVAQNAVYFGYDFSTKILSLRLCFKSTTEIECEESMAGPKTLLELPLTSFLIDYKSKNQNASGLRKLTTCTESCYSSTLSKFTAVYNFYIDYPYIIRIKVDEAVAEQIMLQGAKDIRVASNMNWSMKPRYHAFVSLEPPKKVDYMSLLRLVPNQICLFHPNGTKVYCGGIDSYSYHSSFIKTK